MQSFDEIYKLYHRKVRRVIANLVHDSRTAEELTQVAMFKVHRGLPSYDPTYALSTWIYRIARNVAVDHLRKKALSDGFQDGEIPLHAESLESSPEQVTLAVESFYNFQDMLDHCTPKQAQVLWYRYAQGYTVEEVAEKLGSTESSVKCLQTRAFKTLKELKK